MLLLATVSTPVYAQSVSTSAPTSLIGPGVSVELAQHRARTIRETRYTLALDVTEREVARGQVTIRFVRGDSGDVVLDFRGTAVHEIRANGSTVDPAAWNRAHIVIPRRLLVGGENAIDVVFDAPIAAAGASIIRTKDATDGREYLYTLLVPSDANLLFPCFDQPDLKARVAFMLTTPGEWHGLANGELVSRDSVGGATSRITHRFAETRPISTYLVAFAAGPWSIATRQAPLRSGGAAATVALYARASRAKEAEVDSILTANTRALAWLGDYFGVPYPFDKFASLLAPAFPFGGMEHPGAIFYNEESFIYRERPTLTQLLGRQATIYHEVAHQWFGDYTTMRWFDDLWLKEGFATFMAAKMQDATDPNSNAWKTFYLRNKPVAYATDVTAGTTAVWQSLANLDQAKSNYGPIVYNKAPSVLRQLEYAVGAPAFQRGVQAFLRAHAYGNATWRDLLGAIGGAAGIDLTSWGRQWILRPGMPIVEQRLVTRGGRIVSLTLIQRPAQPTLSGRGAWPLKTRVVAHYSNAPARAFAVTMTRDTTVVREAAGLPAPDYVYANDGDFGYALVLTDSASTRWLAENVERVGDDFERAMLFGSLWDLVRETRMAPARYAAIAMRAIPRERDEQTATTLIGRLGTVLSRYVHPPTRDSITPGAERMLLAGASDTTRSYGVRKAQLDALISLARTPTALARLDAWLDSITALGLPLRPPTRWSIVTRLVAERATSAERRLAAEAKRDSTTEGQRQAFVAAAARPDAENKAQYFRRYFAERDLNEEWVTSSLRAFHEPEQSALTRAYLTAALDSLPFIQKNRRIFFLGSWLSATIGGQSESESLAAIDAWLTAHPTLATDLRQKILQSRDELERVVAIRRAQEIRHP